MRAAAEEATPEGGVDGTGVPQEHRSAYASQSALNPSLLPPTPLPARCLLLLLQMVEVFMPQYLPMLVPPVPWSRNNLGGHLTLRNTVMRIRGSRLQQEMLDAADQEMIAQEEEDARRRTAGELLDPDAPRGLKKVRTCTSQCARAQDGMQNHACLTLSVCPPVHARRRRLVCLPGQVYEALNVLGQTPWSINSDVFRVVETGAGCGGIRGCTDAVRCGAV